MDWGSFDGSGTRTNGRNGKDWEGRALSSRGAERRQLKWKRQDVERAGKVGDALAAHEGQGGQGKRGG